MLIELLIFLIPGLLIALLIIICCLSSNDVDNYDDYLNDYDHNYGLYREEWSEEKKKKYRTKW
jgi:hypothetical protein